MHDRQRTRREPGDAVRVEDVIPAEILNDTRVDREYLEQVFREPQKFLPPRAEPEPKPKPEQLEAPGQPESRLARRAKLAGLATAAALVAAAIIVAWALSTQHRPRAVDGPGSREITGAAALGGFAVPSPPASGPGTTTPTKASPKQTSVQSVAGTERSNAAPPTSAMTATPAAPRGLTHTTVPQKLETVKKFYEMVDLNPQDALSLLVPVLAGEEPGDLVRAWTSMDSIQLHEAHIQPDGSILAIVTMRRPDGSQLRITQLLSLADDASGLISGARLLSIQRL